LFVLIFKVKIVLYDYPLTYLKLKYKNTSLRACLCPAFALPLPCLCRQAGGRQAVFWECFYDMATYCFSEHKDYFNSQ